MDITNLEPKSLWNHFYNLTQIPRPSKHEKLAVEYVKKICSSKNLAFKIDPIGNILAQKPASKGFEGKSGIILQAHLDMVPQKNEGINHNFEKDPLQIKTEGDWVKAVDTTLGADNGIGVAAMLAILESSDIEHGPIEALFTIDEETGMTGAFELQKDWLRGETLINLDSEDDRELFIGCAGGVDLNVTKKTDYIHAASENIMIELNVKGLKGGHSGLDINLGRENANLLANRVVNSLSNEIEVWIAEFKGGNLRNAIPREAKVRFCINKTDLKVAQELLKKTTEQIIEEVILVEPELKISYESATNIPKLMLSKEDSKNLMRAINTCPNGVLKMIATMPDVVETSSNMAIVDISPTNFHFSFLVRSTIESSKWYLAGKIVDCFSLIGAKTAFSGNYPGWIPDINSSILEVCTRTYENLYKTIPEKKAIHAGLETGIIGSKYPGMDMISIGPLIKFPHSPDEMVSISSVSRFWKFLLEILKSRK